MHFKDILKNIHNKKIHWNHHFIIVNHNFWHYRHTSCRIEWFAIQNVIFNISIIVIEIAVYKKKNIYDIFKMCYCKHSLCAITKGQLKPETSAVIWRLSEQMYLLSMLWIATMIFLNSNQNRSRDNCWSLLYNSLRCGNMNKWTYKNNNKQSCWTSFSTHSRYDVSVEAKTTRFSSMFLMIIFLFDCRSTYTKFVCFLQYIYFFFSSIIILSAYHLELWQYDRFQVQWLTLLINSFSFFLNHTFNDSERQTTFVYRYKY